MITTSDRFLRSCRKIRFQVSIPSMVIASCVVFPVAAPSLHGLGPLVLYAQITLEALTDVLIYIWQLRLAKGS